MSGSRQVVNDGQSFVNVVLNSPLAYCPSIVRTINLIPKLYIQLLGNIQNHVRQCFYAVAAKIKILETNLIKLKDHQDVNSKWVLRLASRSLGDEIVYFLNRLILYGSQLGRVKRDRASDRYTRTLIKFQTFCLLILQRSTIILEFESYWDHQR